jgi:transcriptional regulator with XRE-family HTH domain
METLGDRLRALREEKKDTQEALAKIAGVTKQAISKIERAGVIDPSGTTLEPIARRYGVRLRWLLTGEMPKYAQGAPEQHSQPLRLDPEIVRATAQALREVYDEDFGLVYSITENPELFVETYERIVERGRIDLRSNMRWLGARVARAQQGAPTDERSDGTHGEGHDKGKSGSG